MIKENCDDSPEVPGQCHVDIFSKVGNILLLFFAVSVHNSTERLLFGSICVESFLDAYFPEVVCSFPS